MPETTPPALSATTPLLWPAAGLHLLQTSEHGRLQATPAWWRHWLARPELTLVAESCGGERALHRLLEGDPLADVPPKLLAAVADADVRESWQHWLGLRQAVHEAGSLQAWYLHQFRGGVQVPPLFLDLVAQVLVQHLIEGDPAMAGEALAWRAGELFFRHQRIHTEEGRLLAADSATVAELAPTQGLGELGRLLAQAQVQAARLDLTVLRPETAARYFTEAARPEFRSSMVLDLAHELRTDVGHGVHFTLTNAQSGLKPLARLLQHWVRELLGVGVQIEPAARIDDANWRWHVGLDAEASALLNDLYTGADIPDEQRARLISLFTLRFDDARDMRADVAGRPVYLALAADARGQLRMKPQNLLLNLPLAARN